jgi:glucose/arabinose dehydrogenase
MAKTQVDSLPPPHATKSVMNFSNVIGWSEGKTPVAPEGFIVSKWADELISPRWIYVTPNGDVLITEANTELKGIKKIGAKIIGYSNSQRIDESANRVTLFRDTDKDGKPSGEPEDFLTGFISNKEKEEVHGRPVGIAMLPDGSMLVADDAGNIIWRVARQ